MSKRFPMDYTHAELAKLVLHHHDEHMKAKTQAFKLRQRLIAAQKELSALKRNKG